MAGEIRRHGSFSLRPLEHLRNLTRQEAEMFASSVHPGRKPPHTRAATPRGAPAPTAPNRIATPSNRGLVFGLVAAKSERSTLTPVSWRNNHHAELEATTRRAS
ncbi:MAG: hypothetical protein ABI548_26735 [Polyangiaceae bacterium]